MPEPRRSDSIFVDRARQSLSRFIYFACPLVLCILLSINSRIRSHRHHRHWHWGPLRDQCSNHCVPYLCNNSVPMLGRRLDASIRSSAYSLRVRHYWRTTCRAQMRRQRRVMCVLYPVPY
eukprot:COSAG02_NODE_26806_length_624_cov_0.659048_1_plen_119_part_10